METGFKAFLKRMDLDPDVEHSGWIKTLAECWNQSRNEALEETTKIIKEEFAKLRQIR